MSDLHMCRFQVESSDVLQDMRINVSPVIGSSNQTAGIKYALARYLTDMEIIDDLLEHATSRVLWAVHRPRKWERGWYVRIRNPRWAPGEFISLAPERSAEGALGFTARTKPAIDRMVDDSLSHCYPPAGRTSASSPPPLPRTSIAKETPILPIITKPSQVTPFVLAPLLAAPTAPPTMGSLLSRALSAFQSLSAHVYPNAPTNSNSFTLMTPRAKLDVGGPSPAGSPPPPPYVPIGIADATPATINGIASPTIAPLTPVILPFLPPPPLLTYTDTTPVWSVSITSGFIDIDMAQAAMFAIAQRENFTTKPQDIPRFVVEDDTSSEASGSSTAHIQEPTPERRARADTDEDLTSFWITVALTYLAFLGERQSYLAALND